MRCLVVRAVCSFGEPVRLRIMELVNQDGRSAGELRLSDVLFDKGSQSFSTMAAMPSNVEAIEASLLFSARMNSHVALVGPSGWGKTHLLKAVAYRMNSEPGVTTEPQGVEDFLHNPHRADTTMPLLLDDVQLILGRARQKLMLRLALERRVRTGRQTMLAFSSPMTSRQMSAFLPLSREWVVARIEEPAPEERTLLINQLAHAEGLSLSPTLVRIIARQMHGNGRTLSGALKRLRLAGQSWLDSRGTLRACGLLDPFFSDNSAWDLKHSIMVVSESSHAQFSMVSSLDLALYTMLRETCLTETEVARVAGVSPSEAYQRANRFASQAELSATVHGYLSQFAENVVSTLAD